MKKKKVAVIGAGVSGLISSRELRREGHRVVVFEKGDRIGGTWVYDPRVESDLLGLDPNRNIIHSSLYLSLRTNLPKIHMGFSDYPFTNRNYGDPRCFPSHEEVLKFLNDFAQQFRLPELIRLNTEVVRVERIESGDNDQWVVESTSKPGGDELTLEETFDAVVVCNGHNTVPKLANIDGIENWRGRQIHCHNYRVPEQYRDQVVVVIGDGPSGQDISRDIAKVAKEIHFSSKSPDVKAASKLEDHDNIWQHSKISHVCGHDGRVAFKDGASIHADIILHCTGYKYHFPFLETKGIVTVEDNRVGPLYRHVFPPKLAPNLSFIGIPSKVILFRLLELQAKWVSRVLSGKVYLPPEEEMLVDTEQHYQRMKESGIPKRHTHRLSLTEFQYVDWIAAQLSEPPLEDELKQLLVKLMDTVATFGWVTYREMDIFA